MSVRLRALTPVVGAAPGETVVAQVEVHNDGASDATVVVHVVGLVADPLDETAHAATEHVEIPARSSAVVDIPVAVPRTLGIGQHAAAFEATSSRPDDRAVLTPFTVSIASVERVELTAQPSTIRARRRADFHLDVVNREPRQVELTLSGEAADVEVGFSPATMSLLPGQRAVARGRVKGPRHIAGEPVQHNLLVTATGRASSTSITTPYIQRPLFAHRLRSVVAAVTVVALWLAAIGGVALWLSNRDEQAAEAPTEVIGVDTDGDGIVDSFFLADGTPVTGEDTDGDGIPDRFVDADGNVIEGAVVVDANGEELVPVDTDGDGVPDGFSDGSDGAADDEVSAPAPTTTVLRGTVNADGDPSAIAITLTTVELGETDPDTAPIGFRGAVTEAPGGKIWSARTASLADLAPTIRRTTAVDPQTISPEDSGIWLFGDVAQGQTYEIAFVRQGYDTQAFIVTPPVGGEPIDLDVELVPSQGSLGGQVTSPTGAQAGADITITDGSLTFTTTSDETGGWSVDAVSTPGIYTVSAALRGFATAVRQVELGPGDTPDDIGLSLVPGLGTMTGRVVDANGVGLGAATVTASNGDTTLTTSTLTDSNAGFFSLPQLPLATYTVTATLDGYVTESRRQPLDGSVGGVDFVMTSTTARLTGQVLSSGGGPIASAGLSITTGDLTFRATTSESGVFSVDRLPPGDYTVTVEHYQHESATQFVTLRAGVAATPLTVTLQATAGPPALGTGTLSVTVLNSDETANPRGILGATITVSRNRTAQPTVVKTDAAASSIDFPGLPIGTYTVRVSAPGFNSSPPEVKTVGFAPERMTIELQKLGQANGTVVDSLTGVPLENYAVTVFNVRDSGLETRIGRFVADADGKWQTPPDALSVGRYRVEFASGDAPPGYLVRGDQLLAPPADVAGAPMTFVVPLLTGVTVEPIVITPISADAYPDITGRVTKPRLNGTTVEYDPIDDPGLGVTASCNGNPVVVDLSDQAGVRGPDQFDEFSIDRERIAAAIPPSALPGTCTLTVSGTDVTPATVTLPNVDANNGVTSSNQRVAVALARPAPVVDGRVFWLDTGPDPDAEVALRDVAITPIENPITGFVPGIVIGGASEPAPGLSRTAASTASDASGDWTLDRQVFGVTTYQFVTPNFGTGLVSVRVDESNVPVVPASPPTAAVVTGTPATGFGVELRPPNPGSISGVVTIESSTRSYPADMVTGTPPPPAAVRTTTPAADGTFSFPAANAGNWTVAFTTPPNHQLISPAGGSITRLVEPGTPTPGFNASFVELGAIDVRFVRKGTATPITPNAGISLTGFAAVSRPVGPAVGGVYRLEGIPVAAVSAATNPVAYTMNVQVPGFDTADATIRIGGGFAFSGDAGAVGLSMLAGQTITYEIGLESYGSITGSLIGQTPGEGSGTEQLSFTAPTNPATLGVTRVDAFGAPIVGAPSPTVDRRADGTFTVAGPPGYYRLDPAHPQYQPTPAVTPTNNLSPPSPALPANVFEIRNEQTNALAAYQLRLRTGEIDVSAVTALSGGSAVAGASYNLEAGASACSGNPGTAAPIAANPTSITDLAPGSYCLAVNKFVGGVADAFPAIVVVVVQRSVVGSPPFRATVVAALPPIRPTVTGTLVGINDRTPAGNVALNASPAPVVTSAYTSPNLVELNGANVANQNTGAGSATATPVGDAWSYTFADLPYGNHTITAPTIAGYTLVTVPQAITVSAAGPAPGPTFEYRVNSAAVEFDLGGGVYPSLDPAYPNDKPTTVTLSVDGAMPAINYTGYLLDTSIAGQPNTLVINNVAPDSRGFTLTFDDALHAPVSQSVTVALPLNGRGRRVGSTVTPVADRVRITGTAKERTAPGAGGLRNLTAGATITLDSKTGGANYTVNQGDTALDGTWVIGDTYAIDAAADSYVLQLEQTGFFSRTVDPVNLPTLGTVVTQNLEIDKVSTVTVNTTSALAAPAGLTLRLIDANSGTVYTPRSGTTDTFDVPGGSYYGRAQATSYPDQRSVGDTTVPVGSTTTTISVPLPRVARVSVSGPATASVRVGAAPTQTGPTSSVFEFVSPAIAATGILQATASATGHRTRVVDVPAVIVNNPPVAVTLNPNVTVSGTITGAPDGPIIATAPGMANANGTISGGSYTIGGLGVGTAGEAKTWTISYDVAGVGIGSATVNVTGTSANTETRNIALTVRDVSYTFNVTRLGGGGNVGGATVDVQDGGGTIDSDTTNGSGTATLTGPENRPPTQWRVRENDYLSRSGPMPIPNPILMNPAVTGTVTNGGTPVVGASVKICTGAAAPLACVATATTATAAGGVYKFNDPLAAGSYTIWAVDGTESLSIPLVIGAGTTTPTPASGLIAIP